MNADDENHDSVYSDTMGVDVERNRRELTEVEQFVLGEVQAYWGDQNTEDEVFFTDEDEAVLYAIAPDGSRPVMIVLTNLGEWHRDGSLSTEALREWIKGPDATDGTVK